MCLKGNHKLKFITEWISHTVRQLTARHIYYNDRQPDVTCHRGIMLFPQSTTRTIQFQPHVIASRLKIPFRKHLPSAVLALMSCMSNEKNKVLIVATKRKSDVNPRGFGSNSIAGAFLWMWLVLENVTKFQMGLVHVKWTLMLVDMVLNWMKLVKLCRLLML